MTQTTKEFRTTDVDVTNLRKAKMAKITISLNAKVQNFVTNVDLSQATLLIVAHLKMSLVIHVRRKTISQKFANLPNQFKVLTTAEMKMTSP